MLQSSWDLSLRLLELRRSTALKLDSMLLALLQRFHSRSFSSILVAALSFSP